MELALSALPTHDDDEPDGDIRHMASDGSLDNYINDRLHTIEQQRAQIALFQKRLNLELNGTRGKIIHYREEFDQEITDIQQRLNETNQLIATASVAASEAREADLAESRKEISSLVDNATQAILSAAPVEYWESRQKLHHSRAASYKTALIVVALFFLAAICTLIILEYQNGESITFQGMEIPVPAGKFSLALMVLLTTSAIWLTRILVKLMMTNLALEIEALERGTMIKTYIALEQANTAKTPEIEMLFYSTLFRPSTNSLTDDSTSPEYIRLIEALIQKKST
jgi:hypothetical protein